MIVIESVSDSKLRIEVGVNAGFRYGLAAGFSFVDSIFPGLVSEF
jgi:hypothetical protein